MRHSPLPPSLAEEGGQMLRALAGDLLATPGVELIILHDDRLPWADDGGRASVRRVSLGAGDEFQAVWRDWLPACDAVWPVAPETGGILERLCRDVENAGKPLLGSPAAAVRLAASKLATARRLAGHGLPVVHTVPLRDWEPQANPAYVIKPDDGAGCGDACVITAGASCQEGEETGWIAQPLLEGEPLSLSALFAEGQARLCAVNRQRIERAGPGFVLRGCQVNALADADGSWQALAAGVARALPGLWGYAGIDLILTADGPVILEVNPRLTTSYVGLRAATGENPAAMVLDLLQTGKLPPRRGPVGKPVEVGLEQAHGD